MKLEAIVKYKGADAHYRVQPDRTGIYQAYLTQYEGLPDMAPPHRVTLARGIRHWVGSSSQKELMNDIGQSIESCLTDNKDIYPGQVAP